MNKHRFVFSLDEVHGQEGTEKLLALVWRGNCIEIFIVQVRTQWEEKQRWDQRWAEIFCDVYGAP